MNILITCGPSYEPLDKVRRLTNFSTGRLGVRLANFLGRRGCQVLCFKGDGATYQHPLDHGVVETFSTNEDLALRLEEWSAHIAFDAVFHAAALCDYRVGKVVDSEGQSIHSPKIASRSGALGLTLTPAVKLLPKLREWFPSARIVGWKYELNGTRSDAFEKAWRQIKEARTDACVLNGAAYGHGFAFCHASGRVEPRNSVEGLCSFLHEWLLAITTNPTVPELKRPDRVADTQPLC